MTVICVYSLKGSPGVTTLSCLLAAAWPATETATVVEADPAGGDLAARFGLSSRSGWGSLRSSARRSEGASALAPHLQVLAGGVQVLVGSRGEERCAATSEEGLTVRSGGGAHVGTAITVVDLGRLSCDDKVSDSWLRNSDAAVVVLRGDPAGAMHLRDRAAGLIDASSGRLCVVAVGGQYSAHELAEFAGITMSADLPIDPTAAEVASGMSGAGRRLERSLLWTAAGRVAARMVNGLDTGWSDGSESLRLPPPTDVGGSRARLGRWGTEFVEPFRRIGTVLAIRASERSPAATSNHAATADTVAMDASHVLGDR